jgi:hypothetical protein
MSKTFTMLWLNSGWFRLYGEKERERTMLKLATLAFAAAALLGGSAFAFESAPAVDSANDTLIAGCWGGGGGWGRGGRGGMGWGGGRGGQWGGGWGGCHGGGYYGR